MLIKTPGGGGYGDPRNRSRDSVRADPANGKISAQTALALYGYAGG